MKDPERRPSLGCVLYDDECAVCRRLVAPWARTLRRHGFDVEPLQSPRAAERLGLPRQELLTDVRLILADGTERQGADVYRHLWRRIWWATPLYLLSVTPGLRKLFDWSYRAFADHRHRISSACRLPGGESS